MPAAALVHAGMAWLLGSHKKLSNRTNPKHPKGFGKDLVVSVREKKNAKHDMAAGATQKLSNRTNPKHPKGFGKDRVVSVREKKRKAQHGCWGHTKNSLTELIRSVRKVSEKFGSFRLEE